MFHVEHCARFDKRPFTSTPGGCSTAAGGRSTCCPPPPSPSHAALVGPSTATRRRLPPLAGGPAPLRVATPRLAPRFYFHAPSAASGGGVPPPLTRPSPPIRPAASMLQTVARPGHVETARVPRPSMPPFPLGGAGLLPHRGRRCVPAVASPGPPPPEYRPHPCVAGDLGGLHAPVFVHLRSGPVAASRPVNRPRVRRLPRKRCPPGARSGGRLRRPPENAGARALTRVPMHPPPLAASVAAAWAA